MRIAVAIAAIAFVAACGDEPTDPSKTDISGTWRSFDRDQFITNIVLTLTQPAPGVVAGKWRATGRTDNACTPGVPCADSSLVVGRNEVSQVVLELLGAGVFIGELNGPDSLRGVIKSGGANYHVKFGR